jgi:hypothetical protein
MSFTNGSRRQVATQSGAAIPSISLRASHSIALSFEALATGGRRPSASWDEAGDNILIHEVAAAFRDPVVEFCKWFDAALRRRNHRALEELQARESEVTEALKKAWGPAISD